MDNQSRHGESQRSTQQALNQLVEEIVDTVAAFDGRLTFTPVSSDGTCVLSFASGIQRFHVTLVARVKQADDAEVSIVWSDDKRVTDGRARVVYTGPFIKRSIRHELSTSLADWYGYTVRNQYNE